MAVDALFARRMVVAASGIGYWLGVALQARRIRKNTGKSAGLNPRGAKERTLWAAWYFVILGWIAQPCFARRATWFPVQTVGELLTDATFVSGAVLVAVGFLGTWWCYAIMGNAWRISVSQTDRAHLVTGGPYGYVRHPIYLFQIFILAGCALLLPTPLSLAILVLHIICVEIKAMDEERFLLGLHGESYRAYFQSTGRLIPRFFRK